MDHNLEQLVLQMSLRKMTKPHTLQPPFAQLHSVEPCYIVEKPTV